MPRSFGRPFVVASVLLLAAPAAQAQPRSRSACETAYPASWGRAGKDVVWVPTSDAVVLAMLSMAQVTPEDRVLDLGAGDGKIAIAAAKGLSAPGPSASSTTPTWRSVPRAWSRRRAWPTGCGSSKGTSSRRTSATRASSPCTSCPTSTVCVRHRLLAMEPGTRVVSHQYTMAEWEPDQSVQIQGRDVHLWVVPARVDGVWDFRDSQGTPFTIELRQTFGALSGEITPGRRPEPLLSATVRGVELRFTFDAAGAPARFSGTVRGSEITGVLLYRNVGAHRGGPAPRRRSGTRRGPRWPPDCSQYY